MLLCQRCNRREAKVQSQQLGPNGLPIFVHLCDFCFQEIQLNAQKTSSLDKFSRDLTKLASEGKLDPVIGRETEIERLIHILSRRTKNNPVLIGDPGVGKTAIIEGLAQRIVKGTIIETLRGKRILALDLSLMLAGAAHRGEFEQRFRKAIEEAAESKGQIILFMDEMHTLVGAGAAQGAIDAANMLKPPLARGEIQMIGATTIDEYRQVVERDGALERRFQPIYIEEPSVDETVLILEGLRCEYETHHKVVINQDSIEQAARLADRYISDRFLPDKAIDVLDEAAAAVRLRTFKEPVTLTSLNLEIEQLEKLSKKAKIHD